MDWTDRPIEDGSPLETIAGVGFPVSMWAWAPTEDAYTLWVGYRSPLEPAPGPIIVAIRADDRGDDNVETFEPADPRFPSIRDIQAAVDARGRRDVAYFLGFVGLDHRPDPPAEASRWYGVSLIPANLSLATPNGVGKVGPHVVA